MMKNDIDNHPELIAAKKTYIKYICLFCPALSLFISFLITARDGIEGGVIVFFITFFVEVLFMLCFSISDYRKLKKRLFDEMKQEIVDIHSPDTSDKQEKMSELLLRMEINKRATEELMNTFLERKRLYEEGNVDVVDENGSIVTPEMQSQYDRLMAESEELQRLHDIYCSEDVSISNDNHIYMTEPRNENVSEKVAKGLVNIGASYMLGKATMKAMDSIINIPTENPNTARYEQARKEAQEKRAQNLNSRKPTINKVVLSNGRSGKLETRVNGTQILRDAGGRTIARYDSSSKKTYGDGFNVVGNGNCVSQYISQIKG